MAIFLPVRSRRAECRVNFIPEGGFGLAGAKASIGCAQSTGRRFGANGETRSDRGVSVIGERAR